MQPRACAQEKLVFLPTLAKKKHINTPENCSPVGNRALRCHVHRDLAIGQIACEQCGLGNPPFVGKHLMTPGQKEDMELVWDETDSAGILDYIG